MPWIKIVEKQVKLNWKQQHTYTHRMRKQMIWCNKMDANKKRKNYIEKKKKKWWMLMCERIF